MIVAFSCETCGYGGYTSAQAPYERGEVACPECGCHLWTVAEPDEVGYLDDDRELESAQTHSSSFDQVWTQFAG